MDSGLVLEGGIVVVVEDVRAFQAIGGVEVVGVGMTSKGMDAARDDVQGEVGHIQQGVEQHDGVEDLGETWEVKWEEWSQPGKVLRS